MTRRLMTMIAVIFLSAMSSPAQRSEKPDLQVIATEISKQAYNPELRGPRCCSPDSPRSNCSCRSGVSRAGRLLIPGKGDLAASAKSGTSGHK